MSETLSSSAGAAKGNIAFQSHVWALALLNGANVFGFIAYHKVQPTVLGLFEFSNLVLFLGIIQAVIGLIMNPLMGWIADKHRTLTNKAFNLVGIGVNFAGVVFVTVAIGATASENPTIHGILRPIVPVLVILWLIAMAVFNSPAMSLLTAFAPPEKTMQVYISFAMVDILLFALTPYIEQVVDALPLGLVFFLGGLVLWSAYRLLRAMAPSIPALAADAPQTPNLGANLFLVFGLGMLITFISKLPLAAVPLFLAPGFAQLGITNMGVVLLVVFGISIALSIPLGNKIKKGNLPLLLVTIGVSLLLPVLAYYMPNGAVAIVVALGLSVCSVLIKLNSIPLVFTRVKPANGGLGIGMYFAGVALAGLLLIFIGDIGNLLSDWKTGG